MKFPRFPQGCSLTARVLFRLICHKAITHRDFLDDAASYRLSAWIYNLRQLGWPIDDKWEVRKTSDPIGRHARFKRYWLDVNSVKNLRRSKSFGKRIEAFKKLILECESYKEKAPTRDA